MTIKDAELCAIFPELKADKNDIIAKYRILASIAFQFHLIGWLNNYCKWFNQMNLKEHDAYPVKSIQGKVVFRKNVEEEHDAL